MTRHLVHAAPTPAPRPARGVQWIPACDCGWGGGAYVTSDEATAAAVAHAKTATPEALHQ